MSGPIVQRTRTYQGELPGYVLAQYFRSPVIQQTLESWLEQGQQIDEAITALCGQFNPATAEGFWLDLLGDLIGEPRNGRGDEEYRVFVQARIRINKASGTWDEVIDILKVLYNDGNLPLCVLDVGGEKGAQGEVTVKLNGTGVDEDAINAQIQALRPLGVKLFYVTYPDEPENLWILGSSVPSQMIGTGVLANVYGE